MFTMEVASNKIITGEKLAALVQLLKLFSDVRAKLFSILTLLPLFHVHFWLTHILVYLFTFVLACILTTKT